jgi:hypothetical protein
MENKLWLSCVLSTDEISNKVKLTFLYPPAPQKPFLLFLKTRYPYSIWTFYCATVDPTTATGYSYSTENATEMLVNEKVNYTYWYATLYKYLL